MISNELSYILKSNIRFYIIIKLKNDSKTPKELSKDNFYITHISSNLKDLEEKEYVICLNPENRKNKKFTLTMKSKKMLEYLHELTS